MAPSRPVKMAVTPVAVIRHVVARVIVLVCVSVIVSLVEWFLTQTTLFSKHHKINWPALEPLS